MHIEPPLSLSTAAHKSHQTFHNALFANPSIIHTHSHDKLKKITNLPKLLASHLISLVSPLTSLRSHTLEPRRRSPTSSRTPKPIILTSNPFTDAVATGFPAFVCGFGGFEAGALSRGHFGGVGVLLVAWWVGGDALGSAVDGTHGEGCRKP
jgi:hypothetical protein